MSAREATSRDLREYVAGLEEEFRILEVIAGESEAQHEAVSSGDATALLEATRRRAEAIDALAECERELSPLRSGLASMLAQPAHEAEAAAVRACHDGMKALIDRVMARDLATRAMLEARDQELRAASHTLDALGATLSAYRRVVAPPPQPAILVDRRG